MTKKEAYDRLTNMVPYEEADYFNSVFATKISKGKEITDDEIRIVLMNGVEDDFITWGQLVELLRIYRIVLNVFEKRYIK